MTINSNSCDIWNLILQKCRHCFVISFSIQKYTSNGYKHANGQIIFICSNFCFIWRNSNVPTQKKVSFVIVVCTLYTYHLQICRISPILTRFCEQWSVKHWILAVKWLQCKCIPLINFSKDFSKWNRRIKHTGHSTVHIKRELRNGYYSVRCELDEPIDRFWDIIRYNSIRHFTFNPGIMCSIDLSIL